MNKPFHPDALPGDPATAIRPELRSYVANEQEFREKVEAGLADAAAGRVVEWSVVRSKIARILDGTD